jgi:hypothetical protein
MQHFSLFIRIKYVRLHYYGDLVNSGYSTGLSFDGSKLNSQSDSYVDFSETITSTEDITLEM